MKASASCESRRGSAPLNGLVLAAALLAAGAAPVLADRPGDETTWGAVQTPSDGPSRVIGTYANGCVDGAVALPLDGAGYSVIRRQRNRYWGHPSLISFIQDLGFDALRLDLGVLTIADLGQPRGGPVSGHASHELGLDVDIWLTLLPGSLGNSAAGADPVAASAVIEASNSIDTAFWTPAHALLFQAAANHPGVDRIFANPVIKRELCRTATGDRSWLAKIRPWYGHDNHLHVRLRCPADSPECRPQSAIPSGDGCGDDLAWWFTDGPYLPSTSPAPAPPPLPNGCAEVLAR